MFHQDWAATLMSALRGMIEQTTAVSG